MSRDFSKSTSNYMRVGVNTIGPLIDGAAQISMHAWVNVDTLGTVVNGDRFINVWILNATVGLMLGSDGSVATKVLRVGARSQSGDTFRARSATTELTTGAWHAVGGVVDIAGDTITPYMNGTAENGGAAAFGAATYTQGVPTTSFDALGSDGAPVANTQVDGRVAEAAIWNGALSAADFVALSKGFSPMLVRPDILVAYFRLLGRMSPEIDRISGLSGTITGTVDQADHPRVILPGGPWRTIAVPAAAAPGGTAVQDLIMGGIIAFPR